MKLTNNLISITIILFLIFCPFITSCKSKPTNKIVLNEAKHKFTASKDVDDLVKEKIPDYDDTENIAQPVGTFIPLTYEKFQAIMNSLDTFSSFDMCYSKDSNFSQEGEPLLLRSLDLQGGGYLEEHLFSEIEQFRGDYDRSNEQVNPPEYIFQQQNFPTSQVQQMIFEYLEENNNYFFDGSEYNGLQIPFVSESVHILSGNICFSLSIYEPNNNQYAWTISKCTDNPDPIFQGLAVIIETSFMSVFEN
jgi:hypothetical protein